MPRKDPDQDMWDTAQPVGGDPDVRVQRQRTGPPAVNRIREHFWHEMDIVPLSVPRWYSISRANADIKYLLTGKKNNHVQPGVVTYDEDVVKASFGFFRNVVDKVALGEATSCWDYYFAHRADYLRQALAARQGTGTGQATVHRAGDIAGDNVKRVQRKRQLSRGEDD